MVVSVAPQPMAMVLAWFSQLLRAAMRGLSGFTCRSAASDREPLSRDRISAARTIARTGGELGAERSPALPLVRQAQPALHSGSPGAWMLLST